VCLERILSAWNQPFPFERFCAEVDYESDRKRRDFQMVDHLRFFDRANFADGLEVNNDFPFDDQVGDRDYINRSGPFNKCNPRIDRRASQSA